MKKALPFAYYRRLVLASVLMMAPSALLAAPDVPAIMLLTGRIATGNGPDTTTPGAEDQVLSFNAIDGRLVGSGTVSATGEYALALGRTASFNGTPIILELMQGNRRYQLLKNGVPASLIFYGYTLPEKTVLPLQAGTKTAELPPAEITNPQAQRLSHRLDMPCTPDADANGDGSCNATDWSIFGLYGGGTARSIAQPQ
jgi:hypothetical protein